VLSLAGCRSEERAPAPSASVSAAGSDFTTRAREQHLQEELSRASSRWQSQPRVGDCAAALKQKADLALCQAAESALAVLGQEPAPTAERALTGLSPAALALARLTERVRYLSLAELAQRRLEEDAGAAPAPSASAPTKSAMAGVLRSGQASAHHEHHEQHAVQLSAGPLSQILDSTLRLERDVIRNLGAYLEYGPLPVRRSAFDSVKHLHEEHPRWPALDHLLHDAAALEPDRDLKRDLRALSGSGLPSDRYPDQSAGTK